MAEISDDYSPEKTLITFTKPIPLLRVPIPAGPSDDPELGPYVLGFPNPTSFLTALTTTQSKLLEQCESGSRVGCSISASNKCTPPWWKRVDFKEREECEEREYKACLVGTTEKCAKFAEDKCSDPFRSARVRKIRGSGFGLFGLSGRDDEVGYVRGSEILRRKDESSI
ncbi:hypothetical protein RND81_13G146500 [Saponaria officinalis]|uniref:Uncharacterized protein n=1 Tax=Saponaria officinalis TaxID=3572 RepID=A0AAW1H410_SAPOF